MLVKEYRPRSLWVLLSFALVVLAVLRSSDNSRLVFRTSSTDLAVEANVFAAELRLRPGMTLCEMGSANGALMTALAPSVMPGGKLVATSIERAELEATASALRASGIDDTALSVYLATDTEWAPGLPDGTCDALYSRMVIHMIPEPVILNYYIAQWARALAPGGLMFMTDHNPLDGTTTGPRKGMLSLGGFSLFMEVVPEETEVAQITASRFELEKGPFKHPFFSMGYGAVYRPRRQPATTADPAIAVSAGL